VLTDNALAAVVHAAPLLQSLTVTSGALTSLRCCADLQTSCAIWSRRGRSVRSAA